MMILLNSATGLAVNAREISTMVIEGTPFMRLVISMKSGFEIQIRNCQAEGVDVIKLHKQLLESK